MEKKLLLVAAPARAGVRRLAATDPAGVERATAPPVLCVIDDDILSLQSLTRSEFVFSVKRDQCWLLVEVV